MTHLPEIWDCIRSKLPRGRWISLEDIYYLVERHLNLDDEDFEPQSPRSDIPKWKGNVRNVLQYRKGTGDIEWDGVEIVPAVASPESRRSNNALERPGAATEVGAPAAQRGRVRPAWALTWR